MDTQPVVRVDHVSVVKDGTTLIEDISWEIGPGERWILFGANGSGKTTLLEVVSSYLYPTKGSVSLFGEPLKRADVRQLRPRIGYVGPAPTQFVRSHLRSLDIVITGLHASFLDTRWHTYEDEDWERASECLRTLHAERLADREFGTMSEGEKKRVLIARSLMADPDLLLLDEPGSGLDLGARERLVDSLVSLAGNTDAPPIVLVTHHVEEIPPGFEHVLVLAGGRAIASGPVDEVLTADTLSRTFDMPLEIERRGGRWRAWADPEWFDERVT
jgi:iron complex transport system ATP-binding protein